MCSGMFVQYNRASCMGKRQCWLAMCPWILMHVASHPESSCHIYIYIYIGRAIMSHCSSWSKNLSQSTGKVKREKGVKTQVSGWECQGDGANGAGSLCSEERAHYASHRARHLEGRLRYSPERSGSHH
jgi:hypothetical protein